MKKSSHLKEMSWTSFVVKKKKTDLVILPSGAIEVYGPHLPLGTDTLVAIKISEMIAEKVNAVISPVLEVGDSSKLDDFPGTLTVQPENFKAYLSDVVKDLKKWGFKDFLFINSHAGNTSTIKQLFNSYRECSDMRFAQIDYWRFIQSLDHDILESKEMAYGHAGEAGTSVMMHLYPHLVDRDYLVNEIPPLKELFSEIDQNTRLSDLTKSGTIGNAKLANEEKGRIITEKSIDRINHFLKDKWSIPLMK